MYKKVLELKKVTQDLLLFAILLWRSKAYQILSLTRLTRADHKICCLCFCCFHFLQINVCDLFSSSIPFILSSWAEIHRTLQLKFVILLEFLKTHFVLTTHRLSYVCCQCGASLDMKPALIWQGMSREGILYPVLVKLLLLIRNSINPPVR